jgi:large subunit ribosomal protein L19
MSIKEIEKSFMKSGLPDFGTGDVLKVYVKVVEGDRERSQVFEGVVIARKGSGINETFTVRKVSYGVGIERIFPLHSDVIEKIKVVKKGKTRRAKLYYLRDRIGKDSKLKEESSLTKSPEATQVVETNKDKKVEEPVASK